MSSSSVTTVVVPENAVGPPSMGHGGWVAGRLAEGTAGAVQVTLKQPTPLGVELELVDLDGGRRELRGADGVIAELVPATLDLDVPAVPKVEIAREAEAGSPSHWNERGVHPICFGCGLARDDDEGLEIAVGPVAIEGQDQVAAVWKPSALLSGADGSIDKQWVLAALDCPGAMAYIVDDIRAGLLGRIVFEQYLPVAPEQEHVVTGWRIEVDGRKMFAGTALADNTGTVLAAAKATWFGFS